MELRHYSVADNASSRRPSYAELYDAGLMALGTDAVLAATWPDDHRFVQDTKRRRPQWTHGSQHQSCRVRHDPVSTRVHRQRAERPNRVKIDVIALVGCDSLCNVHDTETCQDLVRRPE
nr:hypothetical protein CFP56_11404 [Quercus suber]